ncbi:MAG TPA: hypothetical protein VGE16_02325 [Albitalea sp.]
MNRKTLIAAATALIALAGAGSAFAIEATQDFRAADVTSTQSRDDVKRERDAAQRDGSLGHGEASPAPDAVSTLTRPQVLAELREAQRLNLAASNEGEQRIATAAESASIRSAGLRAVQTSVAATAR